MFSSKSKFEKDFADILPKKIVNLSSSQAMDYLTPLKNKCAIYRTKTFLYELCFAKFLRQFDDNKTMAYAQKQREELINVGYFEEYSPITVNSSFLSSFL